VQSFKDVASLPFLCAKKAKKRRLLRNERWPHDGLRNEAAMRPAIPKNEAKRNLAGPEREIFDLQRSEPG
jgi:hypothetical protein